MGDEIMEKKNLENSCYMLMRKIQFCKHNGCV